MDLHLLCLSAARVLMPPTSGPLSEAWTVSTKTFDPNLSTRAESLRTDGSHVSAAPPYFVPTLSLLLPPVKADFRTNAPSTSVPTTDLVADYGYVCSISPKLKPSIAQKHLVR